MSVEKFIADRIHNSGQNKSNISRPIVKIGVIGISLGISVMIITVSIVLGFKREIINKVTGLTTHIAIGNISQNPGNEPLPVRISEDSIALIKKFPFVVSVTPTTFKNALLKTENENEGILVKGIDSSYNFGFIASHMINGKLPDLKKSEISKEILISKILSDKMNLKCGDKVSLYFLTKRIVYDSTLKTEIEKSEQRSRRLYVCGIFNTNLTDFDERLGMVDLRHLRHVNNWDSVTTGNYEIRVNNFASVDDNLKELKNFFDYTFNVYSVKEIYANVFIWLDKLDVNGIIIVILMIAVATINMITALLILILERTNMIGMIKSLGMTNASVRKIFLLISMKLIGKGLLYGNLIGIGFCMLQDKFHLFKLNSETYYVDFVAVQINWIYFLILNIGTILVCFTMLLFPTLIISRLTPIKTLKFD